MDKTLIGILGGLGGMFGWGTSDFFANSASEKIGHSKAFFWSQVAGLALIATMVLITQPSFSMTSTLFAMAIFCGLAYTLGYLFFYKGFEIGNVSVVSAVINLQVLFIIAISLLKGQTLTAIQIPAIALLLVGITLVSVNFNDLRKGIVTLLKGVKETFLAAIIFGVFYWPLNEFVVEKADWLAISFITKLVAVTTVFLISLQNKESLEVRSRTKKLVILVAAVGLLEAVGVLSATFGQSYGDGIIVAPISSALTIVTVALAMIFTKERINKIQGTGIALAITGIILTAL